MATNIEWSKWKHAREFGLRIVRGHTHTHTPAHYGNYSSIVANYHKFGGHRQRATVIAINTENYFNWILVFWSPANARNKKICQRAHKKSFEMPINQFSVNSLCEQFNNQNNQRFYWISRQTSDVYLGTKETRRRREKMKFCSFSFYLSRWLVWLATYFTTFERLRACVCVCVCCVRVCVHRFFLATFIKSACYAARKHINIFHLPANWWPVIMMYTISISNEISYLLLCSQR